MPEFDSIWVKESKGRTDFRHFSSIKSEKKIVFSFFFAQIYNAELGSL